VNLDLFDSMQEPEGAEDPPPPASSDPAPSISEPTVWTVSEINQAVRSLLEKTIPPLWIAGEVANWKRAVSGHCYFTLKDESSQLKCVMWRGEASKLPMDPEEGMRIRVFGQVTLYEARGDYQLAARSLEAEEGEGLWRLAFERLRKQLEDEGLLAPERKRPLPSFPVSIGVVTSLTGAALHDILTVLRRRAPWLRVLVVGARVQGEGAAEEIARGIRRIAGSGLVEVLIVGRGGGSQEDLWAFNEEPVARALAECPIPVVSAVGHEVDVTISDLVADLRAPTPSAAAEAVSPDKEEILRYLRVASTRLAQGLKRGVVGQGRAFAQARAGLWRLARGLVIPRRERLARTEEALIRHIAGLTQRRKASLAQLAGKMDALSPLSTLQRGYAVPLDDGGRVLRGVKEFSPGDEFLLRVVDGRVRCETVETIKEEVSGE
jgi:exodeoxyribonuclease VII large subunit